MQKPRFSLGWSMNISISDCHIHLNPSKRSLKTSWSMKILWKNHWLLTMGAGPSFAGKRSSSLSPWSSSSWSSSSWPSSWSSSWSPPWWTSSRYVQLPLTIIISYYIILKYLYCKKIFVQVCPASTDNTHRDHSARLQEARERAFVSRYQHVYTIL